MTKVNQSKDRLVSVVQQRLSSSPSPTPDTLSSGLITLPTSEFHPHTTGAALCASSAAQSAALTARTAAAVAAASELADAASLLDSTAANAVHDMLGLKKALEGLDQLRAGVAEAHAKMRLLAARVAEVDALLPDLDEVVAQAETRVFMLQEEQEYARYVAAREDAVARVEAQHARIAVQREAASVQRLALEAEAEKRKIQIINERNRLRLMQEEAAAAKRERDTQAALALESQDLALDAQGVDGEENASGLAPPTPGSAHSGERTTAGVTRAFPSFSTCLEAPLTLAELGAAKAEAIQAELFPLAKIFKIRQAEIATAEAEKADAVAQEDYDAALASHERLTSLVDREDFLLSNADLLEWERNTAVAPIAVPPPAATTTTTE